MIHYLHKRIIGLYIYCDNKYYKRKNSKNSLVYLFAFMFFCDTTLEIGRDTRGMHIDEAAMAYDAWCLAEYGVDRWLKPWPIYLKNAGSGQSSLYAFLCAFLFKNFGYNLWLVRIPAVIFSFLTLIYGMKIVKKINVNNTYMPYVYASLVSICPYFIMSSRFGLDCNLMLGISTVFLYYFICAMDNNNWKMYLGCGLIGGIVLYTYALSYIILPLFFMLSLLYVILQKKFVLKNWIIMAIPLGLLATPLILVQVINIFDLPEIRIGIFTITKLDGYRVSELGLAKWDYFCDVFRYIFIGDNLEYNSIKGIPVLYGITNILFLIGVWAITNCMVMSYKEKRYDNTVFIMLWFIASVFLGSHTYTNVNKINMVYGVVLIIAVYGLYNLIGVRSRVVYGFKCIITICYIIMFAKFSSYYYGGQYMLDNEPLSYFYRPVDEAYEFIVSNENISKKPTQMAQDKIYYLLASKESPYDYQKEEWDDAFLCGMLSSTSDEFNYIVEDKYEEFANELRGLGFSEIDYEGYSLFYKE